MGPVTKPPVVAALRSLAEKHGGFLRAPDVVAAARPDSSPLHSYFTWDDSEAAQKYRLNEAARLIRVVVAVIPGLKTSDPVRVFLSLKNDRNPLGGYRTSISILSDPEMRAVLVEEALSDMALFRRRYERLSELAAVFAAMSGAKRKLLRGRRRRA